MNPKANNGQGMAGGEKKTENNTQADLWLKLPGSWAELGWTAAEMMHRSMEPKVPRRPTNNSRLPKHVPLLKITMKTYNAAAKKL